MSKRVLIAPLDWGLGHATRCIPVIHSLLERKCEVLVASSGSALALLRKEFPTLTFFELPSYGIRYPKQGSFVLSILFQLPKIQRSIRQEHKKIRKIVQLNQVDLIISDNRYGCWVKGVPSIFIGHQLNIQLQGLWKVLKPLVDFLHERILKPFDQYWIPDDPALMLSGDLSKQTGLPVTYVGILSRFTRKTLPVKYDVGIILSGPEPQRSILEEIIFKQLPENRSIIIVRGVIEGEGNWKQNDNITTVNFLQSSRLEEIIIQSKLIIARSGYSTIMDLARLEKQAILIPTPGQTEQEYLAQQLMKRGVCYSVSQHNFELEASLKKSSGFTGFSNIAVNDMLSKAIDDVLK